MSATRGPIRIFKSPRATLTIVVLGGVGAGGQLGGGRRWEDQDVSAGGILGRVELRSLQVERSAAAKH